MLILFECLLIQTVKAFLACFLRWKGDCGGKKQLWFPANYVEEISPSAAEPDRAVRTKQPNYQPSGWNFTHRFYRRILLYL